MLSHGRHERTLAGGSAAPSGLPGRIDPSRIQRAALGNAIAVRTACYGGELIAVHELIPQGEVAAVVAHMLEPGRHDRACDGTRCTVARPWYDAYLAARSTVKELTGALA